jgi:hypothetical protein
MNHDEYRAAVLDVAYLAACAVNGTVPDAKRVGQMDLETLYQAADRHLLTGITAMALESAGVKDAAFTQAKGKAIRKVAAFDVERAAVLAKLEEAGIWYMPLKGSIMKDLYPRLGMRQMADNDILYDASRTADVRAIMENLGFSTDENSGRGVHDHYNKPPVCNFEMHHALFAAPSETEIVEYYRNVKSRLIQNEGSTYGYHFSDEDFYVYVLAHEYKHYTGGGTGLRSVLDTYVYLKKKGDALDWSYIDGELDKVGIADFEAKNRSLAMHLFSNEELTIQDQTMLEYILSSGTYGTVQNSVRNQMDKYGGGFPGKMKYVFHRLFLPMDVVRAVFPTFAKYPVLLPFLPFYRVFSGLIKRRDKVMTELKTLRKSK